MPDNQFSADFRKSNRAAAKKYARIGVKSQALSEKLQANQAGTSCDYYNGDMAEMGQVLAWRSAGGNADFHGCGFNVQWSAHWDWPFKRLIYACHSGELQLPEGCQQSDCRNTSMISSGVIHAHRSTAIHVEAAPNSKLGSVKL